MKTKNYRVPREFGEKWIAALRSGEYKQTRQHLYDDNGYCCLGVACAVNGVKNKDIFGATYPTSREVPDDFFQSVEDVENNELVIKAASLNDQDGLKFPQIADWIESEVEFYD